MKILGVSGAGSLFLIAAGKGDVLDHNQELARVFNLGLLRFEPGDPWPVTAYTGRGYWDDLSGVPDETLAAVREAVAAA